MDEKKLGWIKITDLDNLNNLLKIDANRELCVNILGVEILMHYYGRLVSMSKGKKPLQPKLTITKGVFDKIVEFEIYSMKEISYKLSLEIRERFPRHELLEAMSIVFPNCWSLRSLKDFRDKLMVLVDKFFKTKEINGLIVNGILDESCFRDKSQHFVETMKE